MDAKPSLNDRRVASKSWLICTHLLLGNLLLMLSQVYYLIRSRADGQYLVARPKVGSASVEEARPETGYLLMFREHFDALSYLNTHGAGVADRFAVESVPGTQVGNLLKRWGFAGVGIVQDPLLPRIEFLLHDRNE